MRRFSLSSSFQAFRFPGFAALWTGALISNVGTWMSTVAIGVTVTEQTHKAAWTGTVAALSFIPAVLLAPVAGALADRFERRGYISLLNLVQMAISLSLAALAFTHHLSVGWMSVLAFLNGCASTLSNPGFVALLSEIIPPHALHSAMSLNSAQFNLGRIIGPALAAAIFALGGPAWAFVVDGLSFAAVLFALSKLPRSQSAQGQARLPLWRGIQEGFGVALDDPGIRLALSTVLFVSVFVAPFIGLVPVYAMTVFHRGAETASLFTTCQGVGAVIAAVLMGPAVKRWKLRGVAVSATTALGLCALGYWSAPSPAWAGVGIAFLGGAYMMTLTSLNTIGQMRAPRTAQARISSIHSMLLGGGYALGLVVMGALGDRMGPRVVMGTAAVAFLVIAVAVRPLAPKSVAALEPGESAAGVPVTIQVEELV